MANYPEPAQVTLDKYNLTREQWWQLFGDGHCPACEKPYKWHDLNRRAVVDHDHRTYQVRGIICAGCNYEWGCLHENVDWLENMARYARFPTAERLYVNGTWQQVPLVSNAPPSKGE